MNICFAVLFLAFTLLFIITAAAIIGVFVVAFYNTCGVWGALLTVVFSVAVLILLCYRVYWKEKNEE